nr:zinc finger, CCHC-type [Tanacetum cinerariifolium]
DYFLTSKDQTFSTFKDCRQRMEMEIRMKLKMLRTDRGEKEEEATISSLRNSEDDLMIHRYEGNSGKVYKLTKALYGLRQAPRAWNIKLDQTLKSLYFKKCNLEQAVYMKRSQTSTLIVEVYVDDLIITKQPTVPLSSCESEFMASNGAACQALWLKRLLSELTGWEEERITLKVDNISAIALIKNLVFHGKSKHIDIRYHFIHECVENGHINVEHVSGELQRADILTKALPRLKFVTMRQMLGVQDLGRSNDQD